MKNKEKNLLLLAIIVVLFVVFAILFSQLPIPGKGAVHVSGTKKELDQFEQFLSDQAHRASSGSYLCFSLPEKTEVVADVYVKRLYILYRNLIKRMKLLQLPSSTIAVHKGRALCIPQGVLDKKPGAADFLASTGQFSIQLYDFDTQVRYTKRFSIEHRAYFVKVDDDWLLALDAPIPSDFKVPGDSRLYQICTYSNNRFQPQGQVFLKTNQAINSAMLQEARIVENKRDGKPILGLKLTETGQRVFTRFTGENRGNRAALLVDSQVLLFPRISEKIDSGTISIAGNFKTEGLRSIVLLLNQSVHMKDIQVTRLTL